MNASSEFSLRHQFIKTPQVSRAFDRLSEVHQDVLRSRNSRGLMVLGPSGAGKTTTVREYLNAAFPQLIVPGQSCRAVHVEIPASPTQKSLATSILIGLRDPFATASSHSAELKMARVATLLRNLHTEVLVLDEAQHLIDYKRSSAYDAADWLKNLMNSSEITVALVGLKRARQLLWTNEQLRRRFSAIAEHERFGWATSEEQRRFASLVGSIARILPVPTVDLMAGDMLHRLYHACFGLMDYLIKILDRAVWTVRSGQAIGIDRVVLARAFRDEVWADVPPNRNPFAENFTFNPLIGVHEPFESFDSTSR
jgi:type II secretory pathway predicted ATPase ExeA